MQCLDVWLAWLRPGIHLQDRYPLTQKEFPFSCLKCNDDWHFLRLLNCRAKCHTVECVHSNLYVRCKSIHKNVFRLTSAAKYAPFAGYTCTYYSLFNNIQSGLNKHKVQSI